VFGLLNINKSVGLTSHDVVDRVRRLLGRGVKVGHAGTLDPFAEGVLVLCVGPATRLMEYIQAGEKRYLAEVTLCATSTTDDPEGRIIRNDVAPPSEAEVRRVLGRFIGELEQVPPAHSAVHVAGERAYRLARKGRRIELAARKVFISGIKLLRLEGRRLEIDVRCGSGTYIRALARDIGEALGVGGYCSALKRTAVGPFTIEQAIALEEVAPARLISPLAALANLSRHLAEEEQAVRIANGNSVKLREPLSAGRVAVLDRNGSLLAIAEVDDDGTTLKPVKVFAARKAGQ